MESTQPDKRSARKAFTLVELLVVIGIIAVLIAILLPSLNKARAQAKGIQCASNLRQLYVAMNLYASAYNGYTLPSRTWSGSSTRNFWCGIDVLAPLFGVRKANGETDQAVLDRVSRMLDCPMNDRPADPTQIFHVDYTYNASLGDDRAMNPLDASYATYKSWAYFKRVTQVPPNVIVAVDANSKAQPDDERFQSVSDLTYKKNYVGWPHMKKANFLFFDGTVYRQNPWAKTADNPYTQPMSSSATPQNANNPQLEDWMIRAPDKTATVAQPQRWTRGRPIPFAN